MTTKSGETVWHCSFESNVYIQNSITPRDCQRIKEYVTLSEDSEASRSTRGAIQLNEKNTVADLTSFDLTISGLAVTSTPPPQPKRPRCTTAGTLGQLGVPGDLIHPLLVKTQKHTLFSKLHMRPSPLSEHFITVVDTRKRRLASQRDNVPAAHAGHNTCLHIHIQVCPNYRRGIIVTSRPCRLPALHTPHFPCVPTASIPVDKSQETEQANALDRMIQRNNIERQWNKRAAETGISPENPPGCGIVQHDSHMRKSGSGPARHRIRIVVVRGERPSHCATAAPYEQVEKLYVQRAWVKRPATLSSLVGGMRSTQARYIFLRIIHHQLQRQVLIFTPRVSEINCWRLSYSKTARRRDFVNRASDEELTNSLYVNNSRRETYSWTASRSTSMTCGQESTIVYIDMPMLTANWLSTVTVEGDNWATVLQEVSNGMVLIVWDCPPSFRNRNARQSRVSSPSRKETQMFARPPSTWNDRRSTASARGCSATRTQDVSRDIRLRRRARGRNPSPPELQENALRFSRSWLPSLARHVYGPLRVTG
ncbi:hypothetical protein PR048_031450 [Dryococelus australis]|uniref:Uncharacterized protein n=1 Tax=Dryococelus australis TaxID=614101 RepID=A0ABQ9G6D3_9NEOP|nr:hypothetical protein PR048_031450 [Dryococelus australis]